MIIASITPSTIRMVPELNIEALSSKKTRELVFWYLLRSMNVTGCGRVLLSDAEYIFTTTFKYSRRTFYRHLRLGEGKLWSIYNNRRATIKYYKLQTTCEYFDTRKLSKWVEIEASLLTKHSHKSLLWNTGAFRPFGTGRVNHPISRQSLEEVTGIQRRRQQRYDNQAETLKSITELQGRDMVTHKTFAIKMLVPIKGDCKLVPITKGIGNKYTSHATQGKRGMLRRTSKALRERKESSLCDEASNKALKLPKRYFNTFQDCVKATIKGKIELVDTFYPLRNNDTVYIRCTAIY